MFYFLFSQSNVVYTLYRKCEQYTESKHFEASIKARWTLKQNYPEIEKFNRQLGQHEAIKITWSSSKIFYELKSSIPAKNLQQVQKQ